ncbi:trehalose-6-phosphate synthase [Natronococcus sp. A-GB7]|uniref:alpha,alpha-trehalose-phosphate synthase (UDP-forming) n=1 Tax=Natronococcus sp. A-GB7 TaxID=3037649 RepID=UPI00241CA6E1|nr:trehalose-6-phosphate synthase [Natronococcus sp. A-GB7]MDG5818525.1 trehalose-6-phosphate synthase [Natronococcus sp. A-GB7]
MRNTEHRLPDGRTDGRRADGGSRPDETDDGDDGPGCPGSLIVVSNRQPYRHEYESEAESDGEDRSIVVDEPAGGLTAGLDPVVREANGTWIAWGDGEADFAVTDANDCVSVPPGEDAYTLHRIGLSEEAVDSYYYGFSNQVLWPLCHEFPDLIRERDGWTNDFEWYRTVNERFADAVAEHATAESIVWIQDYHFGLAPRLIRERIPKAATIAHFWHIPWPTPETFAECPVREELLEGLLGNDLLGFHVDRYARLFLECVEQYLDGAVVDHEEWLVDYDEGTTRLATAAMGIDAESHDESARAVEETDALLEEFGVSPEVTLGLGVDRLDYSKGIPERLAALERFFERNPDRRGTFTFLQKATPSRTGIPAYERLGDLVRSEVTRINSRFGTDDWQPIVYTEEYVPQENLCGLYRRADVMVISPLLDGMNLVAQEYVASCVGEGPASETAPGEPHGDGVLLLSERTGAHERLGDDAVTIDPTDTDAFAAQLETALAMPASERRRRMRSLRTDVFEADLEAWMDSQFASIRRLHDPNESDDDGPGARTPQI